MVSVGKEEAPDLGALDQVSADTTTVVVLTDFVGHAQSGPAKTRCATRGIRYLESVQGVRNIETALLDAVAGTPD